MKRLREVRNETGVIRFRSLTLAVAFALTMLALSGYVYAQEDDAAAATVTNILSFGSMLGDPGNGSPAAMKKNVIRGYAGPDSPWVIRTSIHGELKSTGELEVTVRGLVLPNGTNPVPFFRAAVSCQNPTDSTKGQLFFTKTFAANTAGNSNIDGMVKLPTHCIAPIILVTSPAVPGNANGFWFAVTGR